MSSPKPKDDVVSTRAILVTTDYDRFKLMDGNRVIDNNHVKQLQKLMLDNGNLTYEQPILVDKDNFVIDGQHRLTALKGLGWEVGYMVEDSATIDTVRAINRGSRNWSWRDVAHSYAALGNDNYSWFLGFVDQYGLRFSPALTIASGASSRRGAGTFESGEMVISDKARAHSVANQIVQAERLVQLYTNEFTYSLIAIMSSPLYNHDRMIAKLRQQGEMLPARATRPDYMRKLEDIYNFGYTEDNRARLF